jgi:hypothetical protein
MVHIFLTLLDEGLGQRVNDARLAATA